MTTSLDRIEAGARSDELLRQAAQTDNMVERGRLIDEAAWWRFRAVDTVTISLDLDLEDLAPSERVAADGVMPLAHRA